MRFSGITPQRVTLGLAVERVHAPFRARPWTPRARALKSLTRGSSPLVSLLSSFSPSSCFESHPSHSPVYSKLWRNTGNLGFNALSYSKTNLLAERMWLMSSEPASADPGWDEDPAW